MKMDRLIGIIVILLQKDKITAPELAKRFEVSRRTINRDIEDICRAGIPLVTTQGYGGGISIAPGYKIEKTVLTQEELSAVFAGLRGIDSISKTSYLTNLFEKLSTKNASASDENIFLIDLASHYQTPIAQKIDSMKKAICTRHTISFQYYYKKGESQRVIEPYRLVFQWSSWYVFGYCLEKQAFRMFKLNRLWDVQIHSETFFPKDIPKEALHFENYFNTEKIHLKAIFSKSEKYRLIEEYGINCCCISPNDVLLFEQDFVSYENMREWVLSFGDKIYILEPESLKNDLQKQAQNMLYMYNEKIASFLPIDKKESGAT